MLDLLDCSSLENTTSSLFVPYFFAPTMLKKLLNNKPFLNNIMFCGLWLSHTVVICYDGPIFM